MTYEKKLGYFFLLFYLLMWPYKFIRYGFADTLWYCDTALIVLAILLIKNKSKLISLVFAITLAMQIPWIIDMLLILFGLPSIELANYMFSAGHPLMDFIFSLRHIFMVPLVAIYFIDHKYYSNAKHLAYACLILFTLTVIPAFFLADPETNMNCSQYSCVSFLPSFENPFIYLTTFLILGYVCTLLLNQLTKKVIPKIKKINPNIILVATLIILSLLIIKHQLGINLLKELPNCFIYDDNCKQCIYI